MLFFIVNSANHNEEYFSDDNVSSIDSKDFGKNTDDYNIDREYVDVFFTHGVTEFDLNKNGNLNTLDDDIYITTTDAGDLPFEIGKDDDLQQSMGMAACSEAESPMYSALVVAIVTVVCIWDFHITWQFAYMKANPWRERAEAGSLDDSFVHPPAKSASA